MLNKQSPSVQIYRFPITALTSIATRISGFALSGCFVTTGMYHLTQPTKVTSTLQSAYDDLPDSTKTIAKYSLIFPACYHTLGGMRHYIWDAYPKIFINNAYATKSSYLLIGTSVVGTFLLQRFKN